MTDLRAFLRSRIRRDLQVVDWTVDDFSVFDEGLPDVAAQYFTLFSPARMRAEANERMRLLDLHRTAEGREWIGCCEADSDATQCVVLRVMATSYLDDKDFDLEWATT